MAECWVSFRYLTFGKIHVRCLFLLGGAQEFFCMGESLLVVG